MTDEIVKALHPREIAVFLVRGRWPHIRPLERPELVCWESEDGEQATKYFLYGHWRRMSACYRSPARERRSGPRFSLAASPSLPTLASAVQRGPGTLEVFPVDRRAQSGEPTDSTGGIGAERALYQRFGARLVVPLVTNRKAVGFLMLGEKRSEEPYSREDKDLLLRVAEQTATALDYSGTPLRPSRSCRRSASRAGST